MLQQMVELFGPLEHFTTLASRKWFNVDVRDDGTNTQ